MGLLEKWKQFRQKAGKEARETNQPDLFDYAQKQNAERNAVQNPAETPLEKDERKNRRSLLFYLILPPVFGLGVLLGLSLRKGPGGERIDRPGVVHFFKGEKKEGIILELRDGRLRVGPPNVDGKPNAGGKPNVDRKKKDGPVPAIDLKDVSRIDLHKIEEKKKEDDKPVDPPPEVRRFLGGYTIIAGGHRGRLYIYWNRKRGRVYGTVQFHSWGRRQVEYLHSFRVQGSSIQFARSCSGAGCRRIGASGAFYQRFKGTLSSDNSIIRGLYTGNKSTAKWYAKR